MRRLLPENTQFSQERDILAPVGYETTISKRGRRQTDALTLYYPSNVLYMLSGFGGLEVAVIWYPSSRVRTRTKTSDF